MPIVGGLAILLLGYIVFANGLPGSFVFDDEEMIAKLHARPLWPPSEALAGPRPITDFSFALNLKLLGRSPEKFRLVNVLIHLAAGLALYALLRRSFRSPTLADKYSAHGGAIAFTVALLWVLHPLQTESVTYIVQRAESLCGMFYLFAMYCAAAGLAAEKPRRRILWFAGVALFAILALGSKPVAITIPLMVLLYDRALFSNGVIPALKRSPLLYAGLALSLFAFGLLLAGKQMGISAGFDVPNLTPWEYLRTQPGVLLHYLFLTFWPQDLCLDYAWPVAQKWHSIILPGLVILALLGITLWLLIKNRPAALLGAWFFGILALTSSIIPISDLCVEHRMYLPLAAVLLAGALLLRGLIRHRTRDEWAREAIFWLLMLAAAAALGYRTVKRNEDYESSAKLWQDVVRQKPNHGRAWTNLSHGHFFAGRVDDAIYAARKAIEIDPSDAVAYCNLGRYLLAKGDAETAQSLYQKAIELDTTVAAAHYNLGNLYRAQGRFKEAVECSQKAVDLEPWNAMSWNNLGIALAQWRLDGDGPADALPRAIESFKEAIRLKPDHVAAWNSMGMAYARWTQLPDAPANALSLAESAFREALRIDPNFQQAKENLDKLAPPIPKNK